MLPKEFLIAVIHFSAFVSGQLRVKQEPAIVHLTEGDNVTLSCHIHADERGNISKFRVEWYRKDADKNLHEVGTLSQLRGRLQENTNNSQQSASLSLYTLHLNDSSEFFCNFIYRTDQKILQNYANGTRITVTQEVTEDTTVLCTTDNTANNTDADTGSTSTENTLPLFLISLPLSFKFVAVVFMCSYTFLSSTSIFISCPGLLTNVR